MMSTPLISIITPVYNSERYLDDAINSVCKQTYKNWEHLIVDDCSTDGSWGIILNRASQEKRIKPFRLEQNLGSGVARNVAIREARGKFIAFLDSDDIWVVDRLEFHINFMITGNFQFSHSSYGYLKEDGTPIKKIYKVSSSPVTYKFLLRKTDISCLTAIYDQEQLGKFYMPEIRRKQDYGLWLSILKTGVLSVPCHKVLAYYRQRKDSSTGNKLNLISQHYIFLRNNEKLSIVSSLYYTLCWIFGGMLKYFI